MVDTAGLQFPHYVILKASAGSGKTTALTERFLYFLFSDSIPKNSLRSIVAITFSNNAAYEMKSRIIQWLKSLYWKEDTSLNNNFLETLGLSSEELSTKAGQILDEILNNYSDFQVKTIDSFMASIFKASALDFDYNPEFEILMKNESLMRYSYDLFLKDVEENSPKADFFESVIEIINSNSNAYLWNPSERIFNEIVELHSKINSHYKEFIFTEEYRNRKKEIEKELETCIQALKKEIISSKLDINRSTKILDYFDEVVECKNFKLFLEKGVSKLPVNKPKNKSLSAKYEKIQKMWDDFRKKLSEYAFYHALTFYFPYLEVYRDFKTLLNQIKQRLSRIFIEDINKILSEYLNNSVVPEIYFRLGEKIHHFFIDEYQDTSPLQWNNLKFLIENALSEDGSLFVVGDTKQAIYSFRAADYKIMKTLEQEEVFPSAVKVVKTLDKNYRSKEVIVDFVKEVFKDKVSNHPRYGKPARYTGLHECEQIVEECFRGKGYVELKTFSDSEEEIKKYFAEAIDDVIQRGYLFKDIAILALKNEQVVNIAQWLNDLQLPFISYSSLDVRARKVTAEILSLLQFLDSPVDDFSFANFLLGDIFKNLVKEEEFRPDEFLLKYRDETALYKHFKRDFPQLWEKYFAELFRLTGYLPVYDLLCFALSSFKVFETMPDEEATFLKLLELIKEFEENGGSDIKGLIEFFKAPADDNIWNINIGADVNAINVMTIHKAKGLGFPVVFVYLEKNWSNSRREIIVHESLEGIHLLKITKQMAEKNNELQKIKEEKENSKIADYLNTLYVAFTRAKDELYILCRTDTDDKFPFDILSDWFDRKIGNKIFKDKSLLSGHSQLVCANHYPVLFDFPVSTEVIHMSEKQRGEFIHRILAEIEYFSEESLEKLESQIKMLNREFCSNFSVSEIKELIIDVINHPDMKKFFSPEHEKIFNEFEVVDKEGIIHRIDRVVVDEDSVTVIDYKTGYPHEEHFLQLKLYMSIISEIFSNKTVKGCLYYIDLKQVRWAN